VKALKQFSKAMKEKNMDQKLLEEEDDSLVVTFTMQQVPTNPSPKPQMISIDHPFTSE
jgi:hypothetical protein